MLDLVLEWTFDALSADPEEDCCPDSRRLPERESGSFSGSAPVQLFLPFEFDGCLDTSAAGDKSGSVALVLSPGESPISMTTESGLETRVDTPECGPGLEDGLSGLAFLRLCNGSWSPLSKLDLTTSPVSSESSSLAASGLLDGLFAEYLDEANGSWASDILGLGRRLKRGLLRGLDRSSAKKDIDS